MLYAKQKASLVAVVATILLAVAVPLSAAETTPQNDANTHVKELEALVKKMEKRIADLEANQTMRTPAPISPKAFGLQPDDFNKMLEDARRQMQEMGGSFSFNFPPMPRFGPNTDPNADPFFSMSKRGRKPTLGVGVDEVSDELKTRYKNDVKQGAFVLSVYPNSPAEKTGIMIGDAIVSFDDKPIDGPKALIDMVKAAAKGSHDIMLSRHGELLKFKVDLVVQEAADNAKDPFNFPATGGDVQSRMELKVSALELGDALAKDLKLDDAQRKKMTEVLSKHAKSLSEEVARSQPQGNGFAFSLNLNISELAQKHSDKAAEDLAGILSAEQLKKWNDYRHSNSSISFSQSTQMGKINPHELNEQLRLNDRDEDDGSSVKF